MNRLWPWIALAAGACAPGCAAPPLLLGELEHSEPETRRQALVKLRTYVRDKPKPELASLVVRLAASDPDPAVRATAIRSLTRFAGDPSVRDALLALLEDNAPDVREEAAATLARWDEPKVAEALTERFVSDPSPRVCAMALAALAFSDLARHRVLVLDALTDPDAVVRLAAVRICYQHRIPLSEQVAKQLQSDPEPAIAELARLAAAALQREAKAAPTQPVRLDSTSSPSR